MDQSIQFQDIYLQSPRLYSTDEGIDQWNSIEIPENASTAFLTNFWQKYKTIQRKGKIACSTRSQGSHSCLWWHGNLYNLHVPVITLFQQKHTSPILQPSPNAKPTLGSILNFCSFSLQTGLTMLSQLIKYFLFFLYSCLLFFICLLLHLTVFLDGYCLIMKC